MISYSYRKKRLYPNTIIGNKIHLVLIPSLVDIRGIEESDNSSKRITKLPHKYTILLTF